MHAPRLHFLHGIKYKFLISTIVCLVLFTVMVIYFWYTTATKAAEESAVKYVGNLLSVSNKNLDVALKDFNAIVSVISIHNGLNLSASTDTDIVEILNPKTKKTYAQQYKDNSKMSELLLRLANNKYYMNGITISNLQGEAYSIGQTIPFEDLRTYSWYETIISSKGELIFIPPHYNDKYNAVGGYKNMVFSYAKAILDKKEVIGFVIIDIRCSILNELFDANLPDNGFTFIADSTTGELVFNPPSNTNPLLNDQARLLAILQKTTQNDKSFYYTIGDQSFFVVYTKSDFTSWTTIAVIPKEKILTSFYDARKQLLVLTLLFGLLAVAGLYVISSALTKSILQLNKAVKKVDGEHFDLEVDIKSKDEIGQLYHQIRSMLSRIKDLVTQIKLKEKEKVKAEIKFLQSQINPHFLYNTLNTIKFISSMHGIENIVTISESLSTLLHINMDSRSFITIEEELSYIESYLSIQKYKYSAITYNIIAEEGVRDYMTLKLLLQPIVENALIHGLSGSETPGILNIKIFKEDGFIKMRVQDNGVGMNKKLIGNLLEGKVQSSEIGLTNVISRLRMYFGEACGISITSEEGLFTNMEISFPAITLDEVKNYA